MHLSQQELRSGLDQALKQVAVGGLYRHFKHPQKTYKVLSLAITEADDAVCVVYQAQHGEHFVFVRPLKSWLQRVKWNNQVVDRFSRIHNN